MNERLEALVHGRVQLVMYRDFTERKASRLKLGGFVKNLPEGSVQVVAEGPRTKLEAFLTKLEKGSLLSRVERIDAAWLPATDEYRKFVNRV